MSKKTEKRQEEIRAKILTDGKVKVKELAESYHVTEETIRQDLKHLEELGVLKRTHGGAESGGEREIDINVKSTSYAKEKDIIARLAIQQIEDNSTIWLDSGSTVLALAKYLPLKKNLTIATAGLSTASAAVLARQSVILIGGKVLANADCTIGALGAQQLAGIAIDTAIMSCDGFLDSKGPTVFSYDVLAIKQAVMKNAGRKLLLADSSKFMKSSLYRYARSEEFNALITNDLKACPDPVLAHFQHAISPEGRL